MDLTTTIKVNDNPGPMFNSLLATLTGDDGTTGSIAMLAVPISGHDPESLGVRTSQYIEFEHEGRKGRIDLSELFTAWVEAIGDRKPDREKELTEEEAAERRHQRLVERRRETGA